MLSQSNNNTSYIGNRSGILGMAARQPGRVAGWLARTRKSATDAAAAAAIGNKYSGEKVQRQPLQERI